MLLLGFCKSTCVKATLRQYVSCHHPYSNTPQTTPTNAHFSRCFSCRESSLPPSPVPSPQPTHKVHTHTHTSMNTGRIERNVCKSACLSGACVVRGAQSMPPEWRQHTGATRGACVAHHTYRRNVAHGSSTDRGRGRQQRVRCPRSDQSRTDSQCLRCSRPRARQRCRASRLRLGR